MTRVEKGDKGETGATGPAGGSIASATVVSATTGASTVTLTCPGVTVAVGGGGRANTNRTIDGSYPSTSDGTPLTSGTPHYWTVTFSQGSAGQSAYAVCAS